MFILGRVLVGIYVSNERTIVYVSVWQTENAQVIYNAKRRSSTVLHDWLVAFLHAVDQSCPNASFASG